LDPVTSAFRDVPRADFLPKGERRRASYDGPLPIGLGQTNSQPRTVEAMLRLLDVRPGMKVLDVGAGSGWSTALLAHLTGPTGTVLGVELEPGLAEWGADNLRRHNVPWASIQAATEGVLGLPDQAPFDRILVSADPGRLPTALVDQLGDPARMVIPVSGIMLSIDRVDAVVTQSEHGFYRFVPLR
jgi:protein-L-isoaspartate(D-aspartate) O-methyltransferase